MKHRPSGWTVIMVMACLVTLFILAAQDQMAWGFAIMLYIKLILIEDYLVWLVKQKEKERA